MTEESDTSSKKLRYEMEKPNLDLLKVGTRHARHPVNLRIESGCYKQASDRGSLPVNGSSSQPHSSSSGTFPSNFSGSNSSIVRTMRDKVRDNIAFRDTVFHECFHLMNEIKNRGGEVCVLEFVLAHRTSSQLNAGIQHHSSPDKCPMRIPEINGPICSFTSEYNTWKKTLKLDYTKYCYVCLVSNHEPFRHPYSYSGCTYPDVFKPFIYAVYIDMKLRNLLLPLVDVNALTICTDLTSYAQWVTVRECEVPRFYILMYHFSKLRQSS